MEEINVASEEVGAASYQVASGSQMLSQSVTEQASEIQELSENIVEISKKIKYTEGDAKEANDLTLSSGRQVKDGNDQMKQMVNVMDEILLTSNEISRIIKKRWYSFPNKYLGFKCCSSSCLNHLLQTLN